MKTFTQIFIHQRCIKVLDLINTMSIDKIEYKSMLKARKQNSLNYWSWSYSELEFHIKRCENNISRLKKIYIKYLEKLTIK